MMDRVGSLNHSRWECKYHVVFIPKYRRKVIYGQIRRELGEVFRRLALQKESEIEEGHLAPDHVHMMISIPPKYSVSQVIGFIKGKSAIHIARTYGERKRNFLSTPVSTVWSRVWVPVAWASSIWPHRPQDCGSRGKWGTPSSTRIPSSGGGSGRRSPPRGP